ncbi:MAG TPA: hypothetical protein VF338_04105 [Leptolinea sp.]
MRRGGILWGIILLLAGVLFLLDNLGFLPISAWTLIFPGAMILIGLWLLLGPLVFRQVVESRNLSIPLDGVTGAVLKIRHGAGNLSVSSLADNANLLSGTFVGGVEEKISRSGSRTDIKLRVPELEWWGFPSASSRDGLRWDLGINRGVSFSLDFKTGASKSTLDLHDLIITDMRLETGASDTIVFLPEQAGFTKADFQFGSARLELHIPENVAAKIVVKGAMIDTAEIDQNRFPRSGEEFCSPDFAAATNKVDIKIDAGVGKVIVH